MDQQSTMTPTPGWSDPRPSWDEYFLDLAKTVSSRADCRRRQHGAVIVDAHNVVRGTGYNGAEPGAEGCLQGACPRGLLSYSDLPSLTDYSSGPGRCIARHAEDNAIRFAGREATSGSTIYITGEPCAGCKSLIAAAGIARIVY